MCKSDRAKGSQTAQEAKVAMVLQQSMKANGCIVLEFLLLQTPESWNDFLNERQSTKIQKELIPIARSALKGFGLARKHHIDDLVQRLYLKLLEGKYFKRYRARQTIPIAYIMGCAPNLARTIARSIWREQRRNITNVDWAGM